MDGELAGPEKTLLDQHVSVCAECQAALAAWRQAGELLRTEAVVVPSAEVMWTDVQRAIRMAESVEAPVWPGWRFKWAAAFLGLVLLGAGLWGNLQGRWLRASATAPVGEPVVEWAEAELPGTSTMVYEDAESETVVIWLMTAENGGDAPKGT
jgi:anti-sigma factor RsiW